MPDTQPKPTAADVLREHARDRIYGDCLCGPMDIGVTLAQHQADMLAAAGLLATPEHDARVLRDAAAEIGAEVNGGPSAGNPPRTPAAFARDGGLSAAVRIVEDRAARIAAGEEP